MGIPQRCPTGWSVQLGPSDLPRAAICADIAPRPFQVDEDGKPRGLPGRVDAWGADPRLGVGLSWGDPRIDGDMAKHRVDAVLRTHRLPLAACVEEVRAKDPTATGVVRVHWRIDGQGRARGVRTTQNSLRPRSARSCFASAVRQMAFSSPVSGNGVRVAYTFVVGEYP